MAKPFVVALCEQELHSALAACDDLEVWPTCYSDYRAFFKDSESGQIPDGVAGTVVVVSDSVPETVVTFASFLRTAGPLAVAVCWRTAPSSLPAGSIGVFAPITLEALRAAISAASGIALDTAGVATPSSQDLPPGGAARAPLGSDRDAGVAVAAGHGAAGGGGGPGASAGDLGLDDELAELGLDALSPGASPPPAPLRNDAAPGPARTGGGEAPLGTLDLDTARSALSELLGPDAYDTGEHPPVPGSAVASNGSSARSNGWEVPPPAAFIAPARTLTPPSLAAPAAFSTPRPEPANVSGADGGFFARAELDQWAGAEDEERPIWPGAAANGAVSGPPAQAVPQAPPPLDTWMAGPSAVVAPAVVAPIDRMLRAPHAPGSQGDPAHLQHCEVIACWSSKGGSGKTTVSLELAARLSMLGVPTCVIDADITSGDVYLRAFSADELHRGLPPTILDILAQPRLSQAWLAENLPQHRRGGDFWMVLAPRRSQQATDDHLLGPATYDKLLRELRQLFTVVVIDCPAGLKEPLGRSFALVRADKVCVVVENERAALGNLRQSLAMVTSEKHLAVPKDRIGIVLNQHLDLADPKAAITLRTVSTFLPDYPIVAQIPLRSVEYRTAANRSDLLVLRGDPQMTQAVDDIISGFLPRLQLSAAATHADTAPGPRTSSRRRRGTGTAGTRRRREPGGLKRWLVANSSVLQRLSSPR